MKCQVCHQEEAKYKSPCCFIRYCSANCYKQHQPCTNPTEKSTELPQVEPSEDEKLLERFKADERVGQMLQGQVLDLIKEIVNSNDPIVELDKKMLTNEATLKPFYDTCLEILATMEKSTP